MPDALVITAPGNLSAPSATTPRRLHTFPGLVAPQRRFVASQVQALPGDTLNTWTDLSGGMTFNDPGAGKRPTLERVNNIYGVKFDDVDDIAGTGNNSLTASTFTVVTVARMAPVANSKAILNFRGWYIGTDGAGKFRLFGTTTLTPSSAPVADTGLHFLAAVVDGAESIMRVDSHVATGDPGTPGATTQLATATAPGAAFAEIAVFDSVLTDAQLETIRAGLRRTYPTLPA